MSSKLCAFSVNRFLKIAGAEVEAKTEPINERYWDVCDTGIFEECKWMEKE